VFYLNSIVVLKNSDFIPLAAVVVLVASKVVVASNPNTD
jgi:hypothetical protein